MSDEKPKNVDYKSDSNKILAYLLIGLGAIWLIGRVINLGTLWPLILIGVGFLLLSGKLRPGTTESHHFAAPREGVKAARVSLNLAVGDHRIGAADDLDTLIEADINHTANVAFAVEGEGPNREVRLGHTGNSWLSWINPANWFNRGDGMRWDIFLNREVATDLIVSDGVGKTNMDLSEINLANFELSAGVGDVDVILPATGQRYRAIIKTGVGELDLHLEDNADADLDVKGGVGATNLHLPPSCGVRIQASMGIGEINVGKRFYQLDDSHTSGIGGGGVWETDGYEAAEHKIRISVTGGVGEVTIR